MTKTADQVRGIRSENRTPVRKEVPYDPENGKLSRAQFLEKRAKYKAAQAAAEKAYRDTMGEDAAPVVENPRAQAPVKQTATEDLVALRKQYADIVSKLEADPNNRSLKIQKTKIMNRIEAEEEKE